MIKVLILTLLSVTVYAENPVSREVLDSVYDDRAPAQTQNIKATQDYESTHQTTFEAGSDVTSKKSSKKKHNNSFKKTASSSNEIQAGNLSQKLIRRSEIIDIKTPVQIPKNSNFNKNINFITGSKFKALINADLIAYKDSKSPVDAIILDGEFKGYKLIGNATMDDQTKRISIVFNNLRSREDVLFQTQAVVKDRDGNMGLDATHESFYWNYFVAETILNTASGFADAKTERSRNVLGQYETVPGVDASVKQGAATGLSKSADRIGERLRSAPEYVTAKGPFVVQVLVIE